MQLTLQIGKAVGSKINVITFKVKLVLTHFYDNLPNISLAHLGTIIYSMTSHGAKTESSEMGEGKIWKFKVIMG